MPNSRRMRLLASAASVAGLLALACPGTARAQLGAQTTGKMFAGGANEKGVIWANRSLSDKFDGLGFSDEGQLKELAMPWEGGPKFRIPEDLEEGFETLRYERMIEQYFRPEPLKKRRPAHDTQRSLMGVTGLLNVPNSYVLAPGVWSGGFAYWNEDMGPTHWPRLYRSQDNDVFKLFLNRGFHNHIEAGLVVHASDANIVYPNQGANPNNLRFKDDLVLGGLNAKAAIPFYDMWVSAGFSLEFIDDQDRSFLDLRTYNHTNLAFLTLSDSGNRWDASIAMKMVKYATSGHQPPVGGASLQQGFSPQGGTWNQLGVGVEYGKWDGLSLILELTSQHRMDFYDVSENEVNYGIKYEVDNLVMKLFSLRQNQRDYDAYGVSLSARF